MKRDSWDKSLIIATLTWIVLWFVNDLALKRWIPQIDLFVWLIGFVLFAFITLTILVILIRFLLKRRLSIDVVGALAFIALSIVNVRLIPILPETPTQICSIPETGEILRFYLHESQGGATTSDGYAVRYEDETTPETTIFYAYSSPGIASIECQQDAVLLLDYHRDPIVLPLKWIQTELVHESIKIYKSRLESPTYEDDVRDWGVVGPDWKP